jgi:hypothetical protein
MPLNIDRFCWNSRHAEKGVFGPHLGLGNEIVDRRLDTESESLHSEDDQRCLNTAEKNTVTTRP